MMEVDKVRSRKEDLIKIAESQNLNAKSMKVSSIIKRFVIFVELYKLLMILNKEFYFIYLESYILGSIY
jgi:hypothetical protein